MWPTSGVMYARYCPFALGPSSPQHSGKHKYHLLCTVYICAPMILRTNSDDFPERYQSTGLCSWDPICFLRCRTWTFKYVLFRSTLQFTSKKLKKSLYMPGRAQRVPGGWGSQILRQSAHEGGKVVSPTHRPLSPPTKYCWYSLLLEAESSPGPKGLCQWKVPMTQSGIETATFRLVAQCLNQLRHRVPLILDNLWFSLTVKGPLLQPYRKTGNIIFVFHFWWGRKAQPATGATGSHLLTFRVQ
jgi:hypothetical protein